MSRTLVRHGAVEMSFHASDLAFEDGNALAQFVHRKRVQVLPCKLNQRIAGSFREELVKVHATTS